MNDRGKSIDKTYLSIDNAEDRGFIHRDYIAHCLRWTHVLKHLYAKRAYEDARILDIGCGRELPMAKMLYSSKLIPRAYYGVDVGPVNDEDFQKLKGDMAARSKIFESTNFLEMGQDDVRLQNPLSADSSVRLGVMPNIVTCFEVLEHVEPKMMLEMLDHMQALTTDDATYFISTPCWNERDCAANHVNEMRYEALGACFERHGFIVQEVYGTFASIRDYEQLLGLASQSDEYISLRETFDRLRAYYDTNFLSCIFAPLFPAQSRNCLWVLRKNRQIEGVVRPLARFPDIKDVKQPWGSSALWKDMSL